MSDSCEELVLDSEGRSFKPSMFCKPNPRLLRSSAFSSLSSRSLSLTLLSAMRSLKDLILGASLPLRDPALVRPARTLDGRLRLMSRAVRPLSMPSMTRAGLFGSSAALRARIGERGTSTPGSCEDCGRVASVLRMLVARLVRDDAPLRSASAESILFFCRALSFNLASMACSWRRSVSSSSPSLSGWAVSCDMGRRFMGEGEGELRSRRRWYFLRPDGELSRASMDDCGGQLGWLSLPV